MKRLEAAALALLAVTAAATLGLRSLTSARDLVTTRARAIPARLGAWAGREIPITAREEELLRTRDYVFRHYRRGAEDPGLWVLATWSANDLEAVHPSDDCYTANGWEIVGWEAVALPLPGRPPLGLILKEVVGPGGRRLFVDLFRTGRGWSRDVWGHMWALLVGALGHRDPAGGKVRVEAPLGPGGPDEARRTLAAFLAQALPFLEESLR